MTTPLQPHTVLCGHCWESTADTRICALCGQPVLLRSQTDSYRLERRLGEGASGVTFGAVRLIDGQRVCIKALSFRGMTSFEAERIFKRETNVLRQLRHRQVPAYFDDFTAGTGRNFALYLVQELIDGVDLATGVKDRRPTTDEVLSTLDELLSILEHLHSLAPPVVHRDIKPHNIMRRRDGQLVLIDFGAVKEAVHASFDPAMSLVGTVGYMAPEQLRGQASPASDLYAVGMVAVFLLSGREPASLIDEHHEVQWERAVSVPEPVVAWLRQMTAPVIAQRPATAKEARRLLAQAQKPAPLVAPVFTVAPVLAVAPVHRPAKVPSLRPDPAPPAAPTSQLSSRLTLGVIGSALCGFFVLLNLVVGLHGVTQLPAILGIGLAAVGWFALVGSPPRWTARVAAIGLVIYLGGWLLSFVGNWRISYMLDWFGLLVHFVAASLFAVSHLGGWHRLTRGLRVAVGLHLVGAAVVAYLQLTSFGLIPLQIDLLGPLVFFIGAAHLSAVLFFLAAGRNARAET